MSSTSNLPFHSLSLLLVVITAALVYTNYSVARPDVNEHTALQASHGIHRAYERLPDKRLGEPVPSPQNEYAFCQETAKTFK